MTEKHESVAHSIGYLSSAAALVLLILLFTQCQQASDVEYNKLMLEREKTSQEAIKAGLVQGEFSRWVKPVAGK